MIRPFDGVVIHFSLGADDAPGREVALQAPDDAEEARTGAREFEREARALLGGS